MATAARNTSAPMKLYVGNVSKQYHHFQYRLKGRFQLMSRKLAPGEQILVEHDRGDIEQIIASHRKYGFTEVRDSLNEITQGLVFSYSPMSIDRLMEALDRRMEQQAEQSQAQREQTAVAAANAANSEASKLGLDLEVKEITVEEQAPPGPPQRNARKPLRQTTVIDRSQPEQRRVG